MTTFQDRHRSDFSYNGSGSFGSFGDILWRDQAGHNVVWLMNETLPLPNGVAELPFVPPDWHFKAAAEFDSLDPTRNADILWQNDNGALALWQMQGKVPVTFRALPNPGPAWHVVSDNDFDGNAADDILFQHDNGSLAIWTFTSSSTGTPSGMFAGTQNPGPAWHVVGTGDTTNDQKASVLWQNDNGALVLWEHPKFGVTVTFQDVAALPSVDSSWHVKGMIDFNLDGMADIVFQNDNGAVVVWEMSFTTASAINLVNLDPGSDWHIVGVRDMKGGRPCRYSLPQR